jgi:hypothetical protein
VPGLSVNLVFQPMARSIASVAAKNGIGNAHGTSPAEPLIGWQIDPTWSSVSDDERVISWAITNREMIHRINQDTGLATDDLYLNDCGGDQKPFESYPKETLQRLKEIRGCMTQKEYFQSWLVEGLN